MNDFTTEILKTLANKGDLNELFRVHLEKAVNTLLKTELTAFVAKIEKKSVMILRLFIKLAQRKRQIPF
ncbi:hypothetical protein [Enterococcus faecium]|uniref:hypothetical protein n=1 Tax=Enterococcus faecium TaxID=1352 RepID=UPI00106562EC|nr:hypothetical protein [Enterococcus faecium]TEA56712.1 hypothetical protein CWC53_11355 [Enterococcus faecium]